MSDDHRQRSRNAVLVKDDVGRAKPTCYDLPVESHAYGRCEQPDLEGAREVTMHWAAHMPRPRPGSDAQDFRRLNVMATKSNVSNAKDAGLFRKHNDVRLTPSVSTGALPKVIPSDVIPSFAYGRKSRPSTPIAHVMGNVYGAEYEDVAEAAYQKHEASRDLSHGKHIVKLTKACQGRIEQARSKNRAAECESDQPSKELFKLSKFKKVQSRLQLAGREGGGLSKSLSMPAITSASA